MKTYPTFTREAGIHLLQTSPWLGNGYELVTLLPVVLLPVNGKRVGKCNLTPEQIMDWQLSGHLVRSQLDGTFELRQLPAGAGLIEVTAQKPYTAIYPEYDVISLATFATEGTQSDLRPQQLATIYQTLTTWADLLYPEGKAHEAGTATSIGGSGSDPGVIHDPTGDPQALVSTYLGNPWVGSDFELGFPFVVDETKMYREETYKDGKVVRNGKTVVEGSYSGPPDSFDATATIEGAQYVGVFTKV